MSEFYPTTTATFRQVFVPQDDYDELEDHPGFEDGEVIATGVPIQILNDGVTQHVASEGKETTVKTYTARLRGHIHVELDYSIEDERTGEIYMIDSMDKPHNPVGDSSWVLDVRKVPQLRGQ